MEEAQENVRAMRYGEKKVISGYLRKEGKTTKWRSRRYLHLCGTVLTHHRLEGGPPTWQIDIKKSRIYPGSREREIVIWTDKRAVSFFADDDAEMDKWMSTLKSASASFEDFYDVGKEIGRGSYGAVYLGLDRKRDEQVAIKIIKRNPNSRKQLKFIERESKIMKSVTHPNIVSTYDIFETPEQLSIVTEFMKGGELFDLILKQKSFTEDQAKAIMIQLLEGVSYLHKRHIVHRDIKPENILCASTEWPFQVKLTDFGLSNFVDGDGPEDTNALLSHVGTSYYLAPEIVDKKGYERPVDVWACGVVLYIMLCGRFPFWGKSDIEYMRSLHRGPPFDGSEWEEVSGDAKLFLKQLLQLNPDKRLTAENALNHAWIVNKDHTLRRLTSQANMAISLNKKRKFNERVK